jgi:hypothetical protein
VNLSATPPQTSIIVVLKLGREAKLLFIKRDRGSKIDGWQHWHCAQKFRGNVHRFTLKASIN